MTHELVARAAAFATEAHGSIDQRRKFSNEPYIVHPQAVAGIVAKVTSDPVVLAAAWLHDVVEDTPVSIEQIVAEFGADVASLVDDLTDVSKPSDGNRKQRLAIDREHSAAADPRAQTVKLADVIHNLSDIVQQNPGFAVKYLGEKELLVQVLEDGDPALRKLADQTIEDSRELLARRKRDGAKQRRKD